MDKFDLTEIGYGKDPNTKFLERREFISQFLASGVDKVHFTNYDSDNIYLVGGLVQWLDQGNEYEKYKYKLEWKGMYTDLFFIKTN